MHVLILRVQNLIPTTPLGRQLMNSLEVLEKLSHLPNFHAVGRRIAVAVYSQILLFTIYSGVFICCNSMRIS